MTDFKNLPANRFIFAINSKQDIYFVFFFGLHFQSWLVFVFVVLEVLFPDLEKLCNLNSFFFWRFPVHYYTFTCMFSAALILRLLKLSAHVHSFQPGSPVAPYA